MPSPRKRIGFLPRSEEVQSLIDKICAHNKLSQSKVTSLLVEEALFYRGVLKSPLNDLSLDFINDNNGSNVNNYGSSDSEKYILDKNINQGEHIVNENVYMIKEFIEYKYFKKIMNQNIKFLNK